MTTVILYSRPGCHLCEEMHALLARVQTSIPFNLEEIDISSDPALEATYGMEIPVLAINGRKAAKFRISEDDLRRRLHERSR